MPTSLSSIVSRFKNKKIVVWGDLILDQYVFTSAGRVSREAPVLVTEFEKNEYRLGGAGNVVMNLLTLGAVPLPVGFVGKDASGEILLDLLREQGIATASLVAADGFQTPLKSRILSGGDNTKKQQILRIDTLPPGRARRTGAAEARQGPVRGAGRQRPADPFRLPGPGPSIPASFATCKKNSRAGPAPWTRGTTCSIFPA